MVLCHSSETVTATKGFLGFFRISSVLSLKLREHFSLAPASVDCVSLRIGCLADRMDNEGGLSGGGLQFSWPDIEADLMDEAEAKTVLQLLLRWRSDSYKLRSWRLLP